MESQDECPRRTTLRLNQIKSIVGYVWYLKCKGMIY